MSLPTSISFELSDGQTVEFPIISFEVTGLSTPNGINYNCSDNCFFEQGTSNTLYFSGLPTEAGLFDINISGVISVNTSSGGLDTDISFNIPYEGGNSMLDIAGVDYSVINESFNNFLIYTIYLTITISFMYFHIWSRYL